MWGDLKHDNFGGQMQPLPLFPAVISGIKQSWAWWGRAWLCLAGPIPGTDCQQLLRESSRP